MKDLSNAEIVYHISRWKQH